MIVVSVGASHLPFDRLLQAVEELPADERIVVQHGPSRVRPAGAECVEYLPMDELGALIREARVVVTHAGVGSILTAVTNGKRPFVVPRRREFSESVDAHQVESAHRFERAGLVQVVDDPGSLGRVIGATASEEIRLPDGETPLVRELRAYIADAVGAPTGGRA